MVGIDEVYRKFGEVSEAAQLLETELGNIVLEAQVRDGTAVGGPPDVERARLVLENVNRSTLGQLLRTVAKTGDAIDQTATLFVDALAERNRLSHAFFRLHNNRRNSGSGRAVMLEDLDRMHHVILDAYKAALRVSGIDLDSIEPQQLPTDHLPLK